MIKIRDKSFDLVKFLAIFLVLYGHCEQHLLSGHPYESKIYLFIYSFHMPLFMMVSGYFSHSIMNSMGGVKSVLIQKSRQLLIPCITWTGILLITRYLLGDELNADTVIRHDYWFLKSLFTCTIATYIMVRIPKPYKVVYIIGSIYLLQVSLWRMQDMYPCFLIGYMLKYIFVQLKQKRLLTMVVCLFVYCILSSIYLDSTFFHREVSLLPYYIKQFAILSIGLSGSIYIVLLSTFFADKISDKIIIIGTKTLEIYLLQALILEICLMHFVKLDSLNFFIVHCCIFPLICICIIVLSTYISNIINGSRIVRMVLFGK